jgi:lactate racemase
VTVDFPYPGYEGIAPVEVPDANVIGVFEPRAISDVEEELVLARGMASPNAAPLLREAVRPRHRVLVLVDDGTRGTPFPRVFRTSSPSWRPPASATTGSPCSPHRGRTAA